MLQCFREQKKVILSMEFERQQRDAGIIQAPKRPLFKERIQFQHHFRVLRLVTLKYSKKFALF